MKRIITLLIPLLLLLVACGSGATTIDPGVATLGDEAAPTESVGAGEPTTDVSADEFTGDEPAAEAATTAPTDDPTLARERDWKLGDLDSPAVTIIEYGDFQ